MNAPYDEQQCSNCIRYSVGTELCEKDAMVRSPGYWCAHWASFQPTFAVQESTPSPYHRQIRGQWIDIYDVLQAWGVANPAVQHAVKKLLRAGSGHKTRMQDYDEALESLRRAIEMERAT